MSRVLVNATGAGWNSGLGGWVQASLSVTAGQTLSIYVGCEGLQGASFNGGGAGSTYSYLGVGSGGGGASDIRTISGDLTTRLIVAGGGAGNSNVGGYSGNGGTMRNRLH